MDLITKIDIGTPPFKLSHKDDYLFVGSCFAQNIGNVFLESNFRAIVNPFGVMYNPVSVFHTVEKGCFSPSIAVITLGTNHVYRLKETGEIVDNCRKMPHNLFLEEELSVDNCAEYLNKSLDILKQRNKNVKVILTVSPIRYAKYGYHNSKLSKAVLLLAANEVERNNKDNVYYFPAYEIVNDELRDYRFYKEDMLHPTEQAVNYIYQKMKTTCFDDETMQYIADFKPIKDALNHKPFNENSEEHKLFKLKLQEKINLFEAKYNITVNKKQQEE